MRALFTPENEHSQKTVKYFFSLFKLPTNEILNAGYAILLVWYLYIRNKQQLGLRRFCLLCVGTLYPKDDMHSWRRKLRPWTQLL